MSNRANRILPHHRFSHSLGAPLARVQGTIAHVFEAPENHHGANHQHFTVKIEMVLKFDGGDDDITGQIVFVAVRFGDNEGLDHEIPDLRAGEAIELQGEYISIASAYPTEDNSNPVLRFSTLRTTLSVTCCMKGCTIAEFRVA
ncbi:hypothetical protein [Rhizobium leucaenae]|uniref:Uncharacterized protein n=1 Tax=Rhizobium leucaenae TaxID=29450 RepID=A0A7W6ZU76_9HYPH|nr:hypothetical protein [Rhizobium leucaenae]MBB4568824.1 hypothetical protein [Rhizobium leucaenae]MBB6302099.1 hypothetical protein [Rhizobium leucaenae]